MSIDLDQTVLQVNQMVDPQVHAQDLLELTKGSQHEDLQAQQDQLAAIQVDHPVHFMDSQASHQVHHLKQEIKMMSPGPEAEEKSRRPIIMFHSK